MKKQHYNTSRMIYLIVLIYFSDTSLILEQAL